ncbi:MAG: SDR family oxidoreductase [Leifsonia sp.]
MDLELAGKTVVVTGAGKGIGMATVLAFLREGSFVIGGSRRETDETRALADEPRFRFVSVDLSGADGAAALIEAAGGPIDIVVNNVGSAPARPGGFLSIDDDMWQSTFTLNLLAAVRICRAALPHLRAGSAIVNVTSENSLLPDPLVMDYSAAKAGLLSFSKALSKELGPAGIRVNSVSPGPVATDLWLGSGGVADTVSRASGLDPDAVRAGAAAESVTGRFTTPAEVADLILILASGKLGNVTGSDFVIDGGLRQTI